MIKYFLQSIVCLLFATNLFGQTNNELMRLGDAAMVNGQYTNAVYYYAFTLYKVSENEESGYYPYEISTTYKKPQKTASGSLKPPKNPSRKEISLIHKLAKAYLFADDYKNAEVWYTEAIQYADEEHPYARYYFALSLMYNEKFEAAQKQFTLFQDELGDTENNFYKKAENQIASCQFALNPENADDEIDLTAVEDALNKGTTNFGIQFTSDNHVIFSSARLDVNDSLQDPMEKYMLDLYIAPINNGSIGAPQKFPFGINSKEYHEGSASLSADGNTIFFTKMNPANRNETKIYASRNFNGRWLQPFLMDENINMEGFRSLSPALSPEGDKLYYASNRPGGEGGLDIWYVELSANGQTGAPVNLGNKINSTGDEFSPFFHEATQTLYYSSSGHIGFGGQDIFFNKWNNESQSYGETQNAGSPINSSADESFFIINTDLTNGFVTSNRRPCTDCDSTYSLNVHCNQLFRINKPEIQLAIKGYVYDQETNEPIPNATIEFKDVSYKWEHFTINTDENGYYEHKLIQNLELFMRANQTDYFADKALVSTVGVIESQTYTQDFYLEKIPQGEITIEGIEYDFDSANLRPESEKILDNLIEFLKLNDNLVVEIRSHTDQRGNDNYNLKLSERRAQSVVDYLIAHDISMDKLKPKGYGETMPAEITDDEGNTVVLSEDYIKSLPTEEEREEAHQRNRRTAFFVLEQQ